MMPTTMFLHIWASWVEKPNYMPYFLFSSPRLFFHLKIFLFTHIWTRRTFDLSLCFRRSYILLTHKWVWVIVAQSCLTLCNPMDCSLPGSSVHGILQARLLEWVAISFSRVASWPKNPALQESLYQLSHQGSLLLRDIAKYKDRSI